MSDEENGPRIVAARSKKSGLIIERIKVCDSKIQLFELMFSVSCCTNHTDVESLKEHMALLERFLYMERMDLLEPMPTTDYKELLCALIEKI